MSYKVKCQECGNIEYKEESLVPLGYCGNCGDNLEEQYPIEKIMKKVCPKCGKEVLGKFCRDCGVEGKETGEVSERRRKSYTDEKG